ncbi:MAG: YceI family protein [Opitutaceae bacterium]|nr:YceI family protein [Opitutaceae bacterium]
MRATFDSFAGQLQAFQADIAVDPERRTVDRARVSFRMADIRTGRSLRDRHMLEWEESAIYPEVSFQLTAAGLAEGGPIRARGNMMLHGVEHEISFPVTFLVQGDLYSIDGEVRLDYRDYGLPVIRKFWVITVDPQLRVRFHLQGRLHE